MNLFASCSVHNDAAAPEFVNQEGFVVSAIGKPAVGQVNLTLNRALDATQAAILVTPRGTNATGTVSVSVDHISDTIKRVYTSVAGAASDAVHFDVLVVQVNPQG